MDNGPAYFNAPIGSRRRQETPESRKKFRSEYDRIFGKRKIKVMEKEDS